MTKIIINIDMDELTSGVNQVVDDGMYDEEEELSCPLSTQDSKINSENRENAIQEYAYGHSENDSERKKQICGTCKYYDIRASMLDCIENGIGMDEGSQVGYCNKLDFTCAAENVCSEWGKGGPVTDFSDIDIHEPLEGNEKDIF